MPSTEASPLQAKVKKIRLEKFENDKDGQPIRENGPIEVWEGTSESDMKCIYRRGEE